MYLLTLTSSKAEHGTGEGGKNAKYTVFFFGQGSRFLCQSGKLVYGPCGSGGKSLVGHILLTEEVFTLLMITGAEISPVFGLACAESVWVFLWCPDITFQTSLHSLRALL
ncbi:hypothetical protein BaRGS_00023682 [Batillaria attramentaria]|uniref:Uncharacterized protein n=1 Tax=Batillaria attramentaria TaxID=370345 RepID=A0ABD0KD72_9CAEN